MFVSGILLAAGASTRFGSPKLLVQIDGEPLLLRTVRAFLSAGVDELVVVTGAEAELLRKVMKGTGKREVGTASGRTDVRLVENPHWAAGMFSSVKTGLRAASQKATRITISPADLPFLRSGSLRRLLDASEKTDEKTLVVPTHAQRRGHPLVIPAALRERILAWPDTARLNLLFDEKDLSVLHLEGFDETILHDVDRPQDLQTRN